MRRLSVLTILMLFGSMAIYADQLTVSRADYLEKLHGFWLGQCIANWTGIITEMDKIGGRGERGKFYTREDWGTTVQVVRWSGDLGDPKTIDWVHRGPDEIWSADDDTDIEYIYQHLLANSDSTHLTGEQIRDGWITHIYDEKSAPGGENFLWVSNQRAHDLMLEGLVPPATSDPSNNESYEMIDAQLTTEIFGLYAPGRPDVALEIAHMPIRTTAGGEAALASEFYVIMHSLAASVDPSVPRKDQVHQLAAHARSYMPDESTTAKMYDFVLSRYEAGVPWEEARDDVYRRYQLEQQDGYDKAPRKPRRVWHQLCIEHGQPVLWGRRLPGYGEDRGIGWLGLRQSCSDLGRFVGFSIWQTGHREIIREGVFGSISHPPYSDGIFST